MPRGKPYPLDQLTDGLKGLAQIVEERLSEIDEDLGPVAKRLEEVAEKLGHVAERLSRVERQLEALLAALEVEA